MLEQDRSATDFTPASDGTVFTMDSLKKAKDEQPIQSPSKSRRGGRKPSKLGKSLEALNESFSAEMNMSFQSTPEEDTCVGTIDSREMVKSPSRSPSGRPKTPKRRGRRPIALKSED